MTQFQMNTYCLHCDYGHKKGMCASEALITMGFLSEQQGKNFCVCYRNNHFGRRNRE